MSKVTGKKRPLTTDEKAAEQAKKKIKSAEARHEHIDHAWVNTMLAADLTAPLLAGGADARQEARQADREGAEGCTVRSSPSGLHACQVARLL